MQFPKTYRAAKDAEKGQWAIGDALIVEIGKPNPQDRKQAKQFEQAAKELAEAGMSYSVSHLRRLRDVAFKFTPSDRSPDVSPTVAAAAGTPDVLKTHRQSSKSMTSREVKKTRKAVQKAKKKKAQKKTPTGTGKPTPREISRDRKSLDFEALAVESTKNAQKAARLKGWDAEEAEELRHLALEAANEWGRVANSLAKRSGGHLSAVAGGRG